MAVSFSRLTCAIFSSYSRRSGGAVMRRIRIRDPASSIRSMALSGRNRSLMYRSASCAAATSALSVMDTRWCASYRSRSPLRISMVCAIVGSATWMGWNRRSSAASFSRYLRYSSSVVAPMVCSSPRASIGFSIEAASMAPSAAPGPTRVWSSSMNRMMSPRVRISLSTFLRRSSKSPRYRDPATRAPRSSVYSCLSLIVSGTSPLTIFCARPSTTAVLPTPASPTSPGLFLVRRARTCMTHALALADQPEQDVLGADVVVAELQRLAQRQLQHLLGPGGERDVPGGSLLALADDLLDLLAHRFQADPQRLQGLGGHALALVDQPEQDVLGADVVVVEHPGLFLCQDHNPPRPVGNPLEHLLAPSQSSRGGSGCQPR